MLVALHDLDLSSTTDAADKFPSRRRKLHSAVANSRDGLWVQDFTLDEIKTLRVTQRLAQVGRDTSFDGLFSVRIRCDVYSAVYVVRCIQGADASRDHRAAADDTAAASNRRAVCRAQEPAGV